MSLVATAMSTTVPAIVSYPPAAGKPKWLHEHVEISKELGDKELRIRHVATGICHTDIFVSSLPEGAFGTPYPKILGHEGAGYVEAIGPGVSVAKVGDPVLLSYDYCEECHLCKTGESTYCLDFDKHNSKGVNGYYKTAKGEDAAGKFFGQSSFASIGIVSENSVVNVKGLIKDEEELKLFSPLGCGLMTGAGAVLNVAQSGPQDIVVVTGAGAVGCGAIMAAHVAGCAAIVAVDRVASRLAIAREIGATHVLDTSKGMDTFVEDVQGLVGGRRISLVVDTTGVASVVAASIKCLGKRGRVIQVGVPAPTASIDLPLYDFLIGSKRYEANYLGDSVARDILPKMIEWYRQGNFPLEKLVKFFPAEDVEHALHAMESGETIKPVIVW